MVMSFPATAIMMTLRLCCIPQPLGERGHRRIVMSRNCCGLEHDVPQRAPAAGDGAFAAERSTVMGNGRQPDQAAACSPETAPSSGISASSIALATGLIPGMKRRMRAVSASAPSP